MWKVREAWTKKEVISVPVRQWCNKEGWQVRSSTVVKQACVGLHRTSFGGRDTETSRSNMFATAFVFGRHGRAIVARTVRQQCLCPLASLSTTSERRSVVAAGGRRVLRSVDWDALGIWLDEPVSLPPLSTSLTPTYPTAAVSSTGCSSHTGKRRENEDRFAISRLSDNLSVFAIFDGHGGDSAAEFCAKNLSNLIQRNLIEESDLESVLRNSFIQIDSYFFESISTTEEEELLSCGTTATVALLWNETELVVASVGDSRAVLCREGKAECLTEDHNARRKDERQRIHECGGFIEWNNAGEPYVNGRLAMTRSIGDFQVKPYGVIALPEITTVDVEHRSDSFLVLTTDGVSGIMDSQEMCEIIKKCQEPSEAAYILNDQALQYGSQDNVTTLVVPFGAWGKFKNALHSTNFGRMMVASCRWG
ncbi:protein phosphatase 1K, mitochondrial-like [Arapaima gigas]